MAITGLILHAAALAEPRAEPLTLDGVIERARAHAPAVLTAQAGLAEARGRLVGASVVLRDNPVVEGAAGPRMKDSGDVLDASAGVSQVFETGGQRGARMAAAEAGLVRVLADSRDVIRRVLRAAALAFWRTVHAEERLGLARAAEAVMVETCHAAQRRYQAGDAAVLEVNVAKAALARAQAAAHMQQGARDAALGELRIVLGLDADEPLTVQGDLRARRQYDPAALLAHVPERPDLEALAAEEREAEADARLGQAVRWPDVGLGARYERDDGNNVVLGGVTLTLPMFNRGQGLRAEASARARRMRQTAEFGGRVARVEVRTALDVLRRREAAVVALETGALPSLDENQQLARRGYEAGQLNLAEYLLIQREVLDTRAEYLDRLLDVALAGIEVEASAGVLQ